MINLFIFFTVIVVSGSFTASFYYPVRTQFMILTLFWAMTAVMFSMPRFPGMSDHWPIRRCNTSLFENHQSDAVFHSLEKLVYQKKKNEIIWQFLEISFFSGQFSLNTDFK